MKPVHCLLLIVLLLPGCTFHDGPRWRQAETFQYVVISAFLLMTVAAVGCSLWMTGRGSKGEDQAAPIGIAALAGTIVLILCA